MGTTAEHFQPAELSGLEDLALLPSARLASMKRAAEALYDLHRQLAKTGDNIVGELLKDYEAFYEWDHYPPGDVYDPETHAQYYYHAHPAGERPEEEHGHFHTFLRPKGMPEGMTPKASIHFQAPADPNDALSHLIGVSMNNRGLPLRLFTVNRWVTGDVWYEAEDVCAMLDRFLIDHTQPSWLVNRWINDIIRLFRPQIERLLRARDGVIEERLARDPRHNVFEDRDLEILSYCDVSLEDQIDRVLGARAA